MQDRRLKWLIFGALSVAIAMVSLFALLIYRNTTAINDGQRAVVCILAIAPDDRTPALVDACLRVNGL